jgi:hypothetical protein
LEMRIV